MVPLLSRDAAPGPHLLLVWRASPEAWEPQFRKNKQSRVAKTISWSGECLADGLQLPEPTNP
jgi:hypothetical protein